MHAYPETLLPDVRSLLADAVDYAVVDAHVPLSDFLAFFSSSPWAKRIERGDRATISGRSGVELARDILEKTAGMKKTAKARLRLLRSVPYWVGWILACCQWTTNRRFSEILQAIPADTLADMYGVYHESPDERFLDTATRLIGRAFPDTRLKRVRSAYGCSQSALARMSDVGLRSIQMYEQRQKDINKAEAGSVLRLARALGCGIEDILEP